MKRERIDFMHDKTQLHAGKKRPKTTVLSKNWKAKLAKMKLFGAETIDNITDLIFDKEAPSGYVKSRKSLNFGNIEVWTKSYIDKRGNEKKCVALVSKKEITLPEDGTYFSFIAVESIKFNNFNTSQVKSMSFMFQSCFNLKQLDLSGFDTSNVDNMQEMFSGCVNLEQLNLSGFDIHKAVHLMDGMFDFCKKLKEVKLDNVSFETSKAINKELKDSKSSLNQKKVDRYDRTHADNFESLDIQPTKNERAASRLDGNWSSSLDPVASEKDVSCPPVGGQNDDAPIESA